jgi:peptidoglycan/xylan/chitin deacetylase (PgdA/CDA1 family)
MSDRPESRGAAAADFAWPDGRGAAVSLSYDDANPNQIDDGLPVLDRHGLKASFYVKPGERMDERLDGWRRAAKSGHEIGNHTVNHPCSGNFKWSQHKPLEEWTLERMAEEMDEASATLKQIVGVAPKTFAYPCGQTYVGRGLDYRSYVPLVAERFVVGRGYHNEHLNSPLYCDLAHVGSQSMDRPPLEDLVALIERAVAEGAWIILTGHGVNATKLEGLCRYLIERRGQLWTDTIATIGEYIQHSRRSK